VSTIIPNIEWYTKISEQKGLQPRCPFATVETCPRYYQSLWAMGEVGSTKIESKEDERLLKYWEESDLWPKTKEYETSISGIDGGPNIFSQFCPEILYDRFGLFVSFLADYADEKDMHRMNQKLKKEGALTNDWRWQWASALPTHYTDCQQYSILSHRSKIGEFPFNNKKTDKEPWYKRPVGLITLMVIAALIVDCLTVRYFFKTILWLIKISLE
jgi:hypothetical protein